MSVDDVHPDFVVLDPTPRADADTEDSDSESVPEPVPGADADTEDSDSESVPEPLPRAGQPEILLKESIEDPSVTDKGMAVDDVPPDFVFVENASQTGGPLLTDRRGFSFTLKRKYKDTDYWWCSVRSKTIHCHATVIRKGDTFKEGKQPHNHPSKPGLDIAVQITAKVKETTKSNIRDSAQTVVEDIPKSDVNLEAPNASRPNPNTLIRKANRARETLRPKEPMDLGFQLNSEFLPDGFVKGDVETDGGRRLVMATQHQLAVLADAKTWYIDGTFKVVKHPFYQLLSIHCFVRSRDATKQVPVAFAVMSRRRTKDYKAVSLIKI